MMGWYDNGMSGWGLTLMTLGTVLFLGLVAAGIVALVRSSGRNGQAGTPPTPMTTPRQILANRLASGEIDDDEYRRRLHTLGGAAL
jgi:putative membrane protein